jgi:hypothetical protein
MVAASCYYLGLKKDASRAPIASAVTQEAALEGAAIFCSVSVSSTNRSSATPFRSLAAAATSSCGLPIGLVPAPPPGAAIVEWD